MHKVFSSHFSFVTFSFAKSGKQFILEFSSIIALVVVLVEVIVVEAVVVEVVVVEVVVK